MSALNHSTQSGRHPLKARGADLYETPPVATEALLRVETLPQRIWEPAAGRGAVARVLRQAGHAVTASDLIDYGELDFVRDFLAESKMPAGCAAIVTNPPYQIANEFARHALDLSPNVYLLLAGFSGIGPTHRRARKARASRGVRLSPPATDDASRWLDRPAGVGDSVWLVCLESRSPRPDRDRPHIMGPGGMTARTDSGCGLEGL
jgi:hypothetical protein